MQSIGVSGDVLNALRRHASARPLAQAFVHDGQTAAYGELSRRVAGAAASFHDLPETVGVLAPSSIDWLVADLGLWQVGRTVVPLPHFFSDSQLRHIAQDAGIGTILASADQISRAQALGVPVRLLTQCDTAPTSTAQPMTGRRIVYTSGSTGTPKGVVLGSAQIRHTCAALAQAISVGPADRHLSVLPFSLLLEAVCGIYLPVLAGGTCHIAADIIAGRGIDVAVRLGQAAARVVPTTTVLVPQLLQGWVMVAAVGQVMVPDSLRVVAVGGAAVPEPIARRACDLGIPVLEGYGLTECGSVVAVNTPTHRKPRTVGRPLPGYDVTIADDGEIIVSSASVTPGYLGVAPVPDGPKRWATGDLGRLDHDGYLTVLGRKDNLITTANGRNVAPEWVETMLLADPQIATAVVLLTPDGDLAALLEASPLGDSWFAKADPRQMRDLVQALCTDAPSYATPRTVLPLPAGWLAEQGLLTANGKPRRGAISRHFSHHLSQNILTETKHAFL